MSMNSDLYNKKKGDRLTIDIDVLSDSNLQTEKKEMLVASLQELGIPVVSLWQTGDNKWDLLPWSIQEPTLCIAALLKY